MIMSNDNKPNLYASLQQLMSTPEGRQLLVDALKCYQKSAVPYYTRQSNEECAPESPTNCGKSGKTTPSPSESRPTHDSEICLKLRLTMCQSNEPYITEEEIQTALDDLLLNFQDELMSWGLEGSMSWSYQPIPSSTECTQSASNQTSHISLDYPRSWGPK